VGQHQCLHEDADGRPRYDWTIVDAFSTPISRAAVKPYAQIGFMPQALSIKPEPYQHHWTPKAKYDEIYTGWAYPPKDYAKWGELVFQWVSHCVGKYGRAEVEQWSWSLERAEHRLLAPARPRNSTSFTTPPSTPCAARCRPRASAARTMLAAAANISRFSRHCVRGTNFATGQTGTPVDFISFHARASRVLPTAHVVMGIAQSAPRHRLGFAVVASFPELKTNLIIIASPTPRLRGVPGTELGYRNGHHVFQLHCRELRSQIRAGRPPRREPRRRADVGLRV